MGFAWRRTATPESAPTAGSGATAGTGAAGARNAALAAALAVSFRRAPDCKAVVAAANEPLGAGAVFLRAELRGVGIEAFTTRGVLLGRAGVAESSTSDLTDWLRSISARKDPGRAAGTWDRAELAAARLERFFGTTWGVAVVGFEAGSSGEESSSASGVKTGRDSKDTTGGIVDTRGAWTEVHVWGTSGFDGLFDGGLKEGLTMGLTVG